MTTARTRPAEPDACWCPHGRPTTIARFVDQRLVTVELRHRIHCGRPSTWIAPRDYQADIRTRAPRGGRR